MTLEDFLAEWRSPSPTLTVHTSGSTGTPKPIIVEKRRMRASAVKTCRFLGLTADDVALLCMPLDYIAGKMVVVRSLVSGMELISVAPSGHPLRGLVRQPSFVAMVPMQVYNALYEPQERERLRGVRQLIIGGGALDADLERELRSFPNAVWSTYGMTETLSHIALRRINGPTASPYYKPMEGVEVSQTADGCLEIFAPDVCAERLQTHDIVELCSDGFRILGRKDNVIDTGGIKVQAELVEEALRPHLHQPFAISKRADSKFGEIVVLVVEGRADITMLQVLCQQCLPKFWQPKSFVALPEIPHTATGKIARKRLEQFLSETEQKAFPLLL